MNPLISCTCITYRRPALLKRAIDCFRAQSYAEKELVVVYHPSDHATCGVLEAAVSDLPLQPLAIDEPLSLGALRNRAIGHARGAFICQWDDDDWYHKDRIAHQFESLRSHNAAGSVLDRITLLDSTHSQAYLSCHRLWEGSVLCRKEALQLKGYEDLQKGEDSDLIYQLFARKLLHVLSDAPHLYLYHFHGANTWSLDHFNIFYRHSTPLPGYQSKALEQLVLPGSDCTYASDAINHLIRCCQS